MQRRLLCPNLRGAGVDGLSPGRSTFCIHLALGSMVQKVALITSKGPQQGAGTDIGEQRCGGRRRCWDWAVAGEVSQEV